MGHDTTGDLGLREKALRLALTTAGAAVGAAALVSIASSGLAVYLARRIVVPENQPEDLDILHVSGVDDDPVIQLPATEGTDRPGTYGSTVAGGRRLVQGG